MKPDAFHAELTEQGEQILVSGVQPIGTNERVRAMMNAPLRPKRAQKPCDIGLFDDNARNQLDFFLNPSPTGSKGGAP